MTIIWDNPVAFLMFFAAVMLTLVISLRMAILVVDRWFDWRARRARQRAFKRLLAKQERALAVQKRAAVNDLAKKGFKK